MAKKHFIRVKWNGVVRNLEYVPIKYLADQRLILVRVFEYVIKGKPLVLLEVRRPNDPAITRTIRWGIRLSAFRRMLDWDGKMAIPIAFVPAASRRGSVGSEQSSGEVGGEPAGSEETNAGQRDGESQGVGMDDQSGHQAADRADLDRDSQGATADPTYADLRDEP